MDSPTDAANRILEDYFSERGEVCPEEQADSFIPRITMYRQSGVWRSDDLVDTAVKILDESAFDVDDLAENHLGLTISIEPLEDFDTVAGSQVFGVAYPDQREIVICERAEKYLPLYRTCVAHELGHVFLHGHRQSKGALHYSPGSPKRPPEEHEADEFMTALLAPRPVLELAVSLAAHQSGLHLAEVWHYANSGRGWDQWRYCIFPRLIDRLCLSRLLLSIQMRKLGVFTQETVEYHKTYALPNRWRV
jgi:hypothetical protein